MRQQHVEDARGHVLAHQRRGTARDPDGARDAFRAQLGKDLDRTSRGHGLLEGGVLRVVQVQERHVLEPQPLQAPLDGTPDLVAGEVPGGQVAVDLRRQDKALGNPADLRQGLPDAALGVPRAVRRRRV